MEELSRTRPGREARERAGARRIGRAARWIAWAFAAALALLLLQSFLTAGAARPLVKAAVLALAVLTWFRPGDALLVVAAFLPIAGVTGAVLGSPGFGIHTLVLAFAAPWLVRHARWPVGRTAASRLWAAAALMALVVVASGVVQLAGLQPRVDYPGPFVRSLLQVMTTHLLADPQEFQVVRLVVIFLAGLVLLVAAEATGAADPRLPRRLAGMFVVGAVGAAALNVQRLATIALRSPVPMEQLEAYVISARLNIHYSDFNAAGSYFAASLLLALGLARRRRPGAIGWAVSAGVIAAALWLTGSRTAVLAAAVVLVVDTLRTLVSRANSGVVHRAIAAVLVVVLIGGAGVLLVRPARYFQAGAPAALRIRMEFAATSLRMTATAPAFGIGLGRYAERVSDFVSPALVALFPLAPHENAHNNFLQILTELGIAGLVVFALILWTSIKPAATAARATPADIPVRGLLGAVTAFLLTCLAGHPLLTPDVAYSFWVLLGLTAACAAHAPARTGTVLSPGVSSDPGRRTSRRQVAVAAAVVCLLVSIPLRARRELRDAELDHVALGASGWHAAEDGTRFRWATSGAIFFVPADASGIELPLSTDPGGRWLVVAIMLDGRLANEVRIEPGAWRSIKVLMPSTRSPSRFRRLQLFVSEARGAVHSPESGEDTKTPVVRVGKILSW